MTSILQSIKNAATSGRAHHQLTETMETNGIGKQHAGMDSSMLMEMAHSST